MSDDEPTIVITTGPGAAPPAWAIEEAIAAARRSPCQKRKVGISIIRCVATIESDRERVAETGVYGYNGPPCDGWLEGPCDGTEACRRDCAKRCVHAEPRAIMVVALVSGTWQMPDGCLMADGSDLRMVHVKLDASGDLMACDGPSCNECSKLILDCGIGGIWLYEIKMVPDESDELRGSGVLVEARRWRYYPAREFHQVTQTRLGIYQPKHKHE